VTSASGIAAACDLVQTSSFKDPLQSQASINTLPARLLSSVLNGQTDKLLNGVNSSSLHAVCGPSKSAASTNTSQKEAIALDQEGLLPPVGVVVQDQLGVPITSWQLGKQTKVKAKVQSDTGAVAVLEGQTQLVPEQGRATFSGMRLLGQPGGNFSVTFSVNQLSSGALDLDYQSAPLLFTLQPCSVGQVVQLSPQGFPSGCTTCQAPLYSFDPMSNDCLKCPPAAAACGGAEMRPKPGFYQWHPLSTQLLECPNALSCKPQDEALAAVQRLALEQVNGVLGEKPRSAAATLRGDRLTDLYQQLQCAEGKHLLQYCGTLDLY
jgi:hypothetical protein